MARGYAAIAGEPAQIDPVPELPATGRFRIQAIEISMKARTVTRSGARISVTPAE